MVLMDAPRSVLGVTLVDTRESYAALKTTKVNHGLKIYIILLAPRNLF